MFDVNNIDTYPEKLKKFFKNQEEILKNTIKNVEEFYIQDGSGLFDVLYNILKNEEILLIHANRIVDRKQINKFGLLNPKQSNNIVDILLQPLEEFVDDGILEQAKKELLIRIDSNKKYDKIHFVVGSLKDINLDNGFYMLNKYGGELLEDTFTKLNLRDYYSKNIAKIGTAYSIFFKQKISTLYKSNSYFILRLFAQILLKYINNRDLDIFIESYIHSNVDSKDIVKIINMEDINE